MGNVLEKVNMPEDLKSLNLKEKEELATEIRRFIIENVSKTGGHLASNLGVVELTIAIHSVFDMPDDKIIWDVGHQTYVHKILTGRKDKFTTLRKLNGLAGFPKTSESKYDSFNTGHSSTSISVALGMARARDLKKEKNNVVAVIGDGALTGGMALEALNDAGCSNTNLIVILNDNEMSISKNVGGISMALGKIRTRKAYTKSNQYLKKSLKKVPHIGKIIIKAARKIKYGVKQLFIPNMFFEDLGFRYLGPIDGNDIEKVQDLLEMAKRLKGPVLVHVVTKKGKGYKPAEENPDKFHSTSSFDIETGKNKKEKKKDYSKVFGEKLECLAKENKNIVAITAAMCDGTGLSNFKKQFPDRFFDVGIAEQHALGMAAGMAKDGLIPVVPIYSSFYQRGYDQVIHDICLQKLPVIMCVDRAGIVGNDGETHQGILDLAFFSLVPNLTILAPKDFKELEQMLEFAVELKAPVVIRYPRGGEERAFASHKEISLGESELLKDGNDLTIIGIGKTTKRALDVSDILEKKGISCEVINARFLKPFDNKNILNSILKTNKVITIEDGILRGGLATSVQELIIENDIKNVLIESYAYRDTFVKQGTIEEIEKYFCLDAESIAKDISKKKYKEIYNMQKREILEKYKKEEERILVAKLLDKIELCEKRNKMEYTDFLDKYKESMLKKVLNLVKTDYICFGGYEEAERKLLIVYPEKLNQLFEENKFNFNTIISVIRINPLKEEIKNLNHRAYLGGLIKLGINREKIGDIIVHENGADIIILKEIEKFLYTNLCTLKRFKNSKIEVVKLENIINKKQEMQECKIIVSSLRVDNVISEICKTSRNKASENLLSERVFINGECIKKNTKLIKENDKITIRGKGRFIIKQILEENKKGKIPVIINFYK